MTRHGEVPRGFDNWRGLLDVSAYDYYNFVMNRNGRLRTWGDPDFARKLVEFANIEVTPEPGRPAGRAGEAERGVRDPRRTATGAPTSPIRYSPDVTGRITKKLRRAPEARRSKPFFIWWAPAAPHREDVATTLMDRPGPDPRPPPRYEQPEQELQLPRPPELQRARRQRQAIEHDQPHAPPMSSVGRSTSSSSTTRGAAGSLRAVDDQVGADGEDAAPQRQLQNTLIIFTSDNGWLQGEHRITG